MMARNADGRWSKHAAASVTLGEARASYEAALAGVCRYQGLKPLDVQRQLARAPKLNFDPAWRRAAYARQLALYLANTVDNIPQKLLARVVGLTPAGVCLALKDIEDLRDHDDFEMLCALVEATMGEA